MYHYTQRNSSQAHVVVACLACRWLGATALADRTSALPAMELTATVPMLRIMGFA